MQRTRALQPTHRVTHAQQTVLNICGPNEMGLPVSRTSDVVRCGITQAARRRLTPVQAIRFGGMTVGGGAGKRIGGTLLAFLGLVLLVVSLAALTISVSTMGVLLSVLGAAVLGIGVRIVIHGERAFRQPDAPPAAVHHVHHTIDRLCTQSKCAGCSGSLRRCGVDYAAGSIRLLEQGAQRNEDDSVRVDHGYPVQRGWASI